MASNRLKQAFEKEGITLGAIHTRSGVSKLTIRRVLNQKRSVSPRTQNKIVEAINKISNSRCTVEDMFPGYIRKASKAQVRKKMRLEHETEAVSKDASDPSFHLRQTKEARSTSDLRDAANKAAAALRGAAQRRFRSP
jgi:transcriptional regulator with XRE-family HTH domain